MCVRDTNILSLIYHWIPHLLKGDLLIWEAVWLMMRWWIWMTWRLIIAIKYSRWLSYNMIVVLNWLNSSFRWVTSTLNIWPRLLPSATTYVCLWLGTFRIRSFLLGLLNLIKTLVSKPRINSFNSVKYRIFIAHMPI